GMAQTSQRHELWLVLSPDCDCVRARYVQVAPVFPVYNGMAADDARVQRFGHALRLRTTKAYPVPPLLGDDDPGLRGYFADLEVPYYICEEHEGLATPYASMTVVGWHLLNALIQEKETRADIAESVSIRTIR